MLSDIDIKNVREHVSYGNDPLSYAQVQSSHLNKTGEFKGRYILAAIDGTGSQDWINEDVSNSHVAKFFDDFDTKGGVKKYFHGPKYDLGGDSLPIMMKVLIFINKHIEIARNTIMIGPPQKGQTIEWEEYVRICLVGHSRGGLIAIATAARLQMPVYFMGLYDAVDRAGDLDGSEIINTQIIYHAIRDSSIGSRKLFGNDGLSAKGGIFKTEYFTTSHGGIGGDAVKNPSGWFSDKSCSSDARYYTDSNGKIHNFHTTQDVERHNYNAQNVQYIYTRFGRFEIPPTNLPLADQLTHPLCQKSSGEADEWIRSGARLHGVPISP